MEATLPQMNPEPSQGSHFFHNLSSFGVLYFTVPLDTGRGGRLGLARPRRRPSPAPSTSGTSARRRPSSLRWTGRSRRGVAIRRTEERMNPSADKPIDRILHDLQERAKELNCLYRVDELLGREEATARRRPRRA